MNGILVSVFGSVFGFSEFMKYSSGRTLRHPESTSLSPQTNPFSKNPEFFLAPLPPPCRRTSLYFPHTDFRGVPSGSIFTFYFFFSRHYLEVPSIRAYVLATNCQSCGRPPTSRFSNWWAPSLHIYQLYARR